MEFILVQEQLPNEWNVLCQILKKVPWKKKQEMWVRKLVDVVVFI